MGVEKHQSYLAAEDVRSVNNFAFTQVTFRLPDNLSTGTCVIRIKAHGQISNSGTIRISSPGLALGTTSWWYQIAAADVR